MRNTRGKECADGHVQRCRASLALMTTACQSKFSQITGDSVLLVYRMRVGIDSGCRLRGWWVDCRHEQHGIQLDPVHVLETRTGRRVRAGLARWRR
jgi:hypothetical protein